MSRTDKDAPFRVRRTRDEVRDDYLYLAPPPRWFIRARFRGPERRRVHRAALLARLDYNTNGVTEVEVPVDQHRQSAQWLWW